MEHDIRADIVSIGDHHIAYSAFCIRNGCADKEKSELQKISLFLMLIWQ